MIKGVFSVFDNKAGAFLPPFMELNVDTAQRAIMMALEARPEDLMAKYPEDYTLFDLGVFDDNKGEYETYTPRSICNIAVMLAPKEVTS